MQHDQQEQAGQHTKEEDSRDTRTASQKQEAERTDPQRTSQRPKQTAEVPLGTGTHAEPPGGGGRQSQRASQSGSTSAPQVMSQRSEEPLNPGDEGSSNAPGVGEDLCQACHGSGMVEGGPCSVCGGTGKVLQGIGGG
jgi:hypothetical protein